MVDRAEKMVLRLVIKPRVHQDCSRNFFAFVLLFQCPSQEKDVFIFKRDVSAEELKHEQVQSDMEIVLLCISIAAIILALVLLTMIR